MSRPKLNTGFKIVRTIPAKMGYPHRQLYSSCSSRAFTFNAAPVYIPGFATKPVTGNGPLCVFTTLKSACSFGRRNVFLESGTEFLIFSCRYVPSTEDTIWFKSAGIRLERSGVPRDTVFAKRVTLLKPVKRIVSTADNPWDNNRVTACKRA